MATPPGRFPPNLNRHRRYYLNAQARCFLCGRCRTPVVDLINCLGGIDGEVQGLLCDSHYNVKTNDTIHRFIYELPINNVHCNDCNRHIGVKFISAADNDPPRPYPLEGKVLFYCGRVLFWDGNSFLRTESGEPVMRLIFFDGTQLRYTGPCPDEETDEETGKEDSQ